MAKYRSWLYFLKIKPSFESRRVLYKNRGIPASQGVFFDLKQGAVYLGKGIANPACIPKKTGMLMYNIYSYSFGFEILPLAVISG